MLRGKWFFIALLSGFGVWPAGFSLAEEPGELKEQKIKAGLFYNAIKYSSWPAEAFSDSDDPFQICLFGGDPFDGALDLQNRSVQRRPINIKSIYHPGSADQCHVVFVNRSEENSLSGLWETLRNSSTLTVSDIENFCEKGGMIEFSKFSGEQIRLYLNGDAMHRSGLHAQEELLKIVEAK